MVKLLSLVLVTTSLCFGGDEITRPMATPAGKFVLGQINTDHDAQQFLLDTETGKLWQVFYDSQSHAYLLEVPILTEEQAKKRTDVKPRGK